jgi:hypothetical protein
MMVHRLIFTARFGTHFSNELVIRLGKPSPKLPANWPNPSSVEHLASNREPRTLSLPILHGEPMDSSKIRAG